MPLAVAVAAFPVPVMVVVLLLDPHGRRTRAAAFVVAWYLGLAAVGAVVLLIAGEADASDRGDRATWVNVLLLALGLLLLVAAARQWRGRPSSGDDTPMPGWMRALASFTVAKALGAGFALSAVNPKNLALTAAAAAEIAGLGLPPAEQVAVLLLFSLIASVGVLTPFVASLLLGERSREPLDRLRDLLGRHSAAIVAALLLLIGAKLIGDAIAGFSS